MQKSIFARQIAPYLFWFLLMGGLAIGLDAALHAMSLYWIDRYLGIAGTFLLSFSFVYSLRKRKILNIRSVKSFLSLHEYMGYIGVVLVLVHAGTHFNAIIPWLALGFLLVVTTSGFTGRRLLKNAVAMLRSKEEELRQKNPTGEIQEANIFLDSLMVDVMKKWRSIHFVITTIFVTLVGVHIITILLFWSV